MLGSPVFLSRGHYRACNLTLLKITDTSVIQHVCPTPEAHWLILPCYWDIRCGFFVKSVLAVKTDLWKIQRQFAVLGKVVVLCKGQHKTNHLLLNMCVCIPSTFFCGWWILYPCRCQHTVTLLSMRFVTWVSKGRAWISTACQLHGSILAAPWTHQLV